MGSSHQSSIPTSDSAVFGYQAKLLSRNGGSSSKMSPSMEFGGLSASRSTTSMASKRNSIDVGSIRGQWAQREAEERKLFVELGGTPKNTIPRPKGPLSSNSSTSPAFNSFSSRAGSPSTSRPMSPEVLSTRNTSTTGNDSLQRLLHRRAKSYVPPSKALAGSDVEKRIAAEPSDASDVGRTASTATYGSERTFSSSTTASMNPLVADFTGSSNASSIVGPNGERRFKSSYMARKDAKKRGSAMSMVDEDSTLTSMISASGGEYDGLPQAIAIQPEDGNDLAAQIKKKLESESIQEQLESNAESRKQESIDKTMAKLLGSTPTKQIRNETKPSSPDEDLSPTVKAFRDRLKNEGPLYRPDMSPSTSLRKKMSTSLLGEPYWPNPNPVGGSNRTPAWKPSDQSVSSESPSKRQSPLASSFDLELANPERVSSRQSRRNITPVKSKSAFKSVVVPPVGSSGIYGETRRPSSQNDTPGKRYGSIGKTDGRKLGKHLPRIASGDQFEEDWQATQAKYGKTAETKDGLLTTSSPLRPAQSESRIANTTRESTLVKTNISSKVQEAAKGLIIDRKSPLEDRSPASEVPVSPRRPELGSKRFSMPVTPQKLAPDGLGMQGLVGKSFATPKASPGLVGAGSSLQRSGSVAGVKGRIRLSKLPASSTSASLAPAPLPSKRLNTNWMDRQRKELIAYEYLCHVGEAQQWIEGCLEEELGYGVVEMEECMTDGVALAKLARKYQGEDVVRQIWEVRKFSSVSIRSFTHPYSSGQETPVPPI
jgi:Ras GTPase-activating-like protein IQGAP2/3